MSAYSRQKAKSKYRNRIRLERAPQKQSSDTHKTPYDRLLSQLDRRTEENYRPAGVRGRTQRSLAAPRGTVVGKMRGPPNSVGAEEPSAPASGRAQERHLSSVDRDCRRAVGRLAQQARVGGLRVERLLLPRVRRRADELPHVGRNEPGVDLPRVVEAGEPAHQESDDHDDEGAYSPVQHVRQPVEEEDSVHPRMTMPGPLFQTLLCSGTPIELARPDLNPIEHLWDELDRRMRAREARPKSIAQLMEWLQEEWRRIPVDVLQTLVESMPDRVAAVIAAREPDRTGSRQVLIYEWTSSWGLRKPRAEPPKMKQTDTENRVTVMLWVATLITGVQSQNVVTGFQGRNRTLERSVVIRASFIGQREMRVGKQAVSRGFPGSEDYPAHEDNAGYGSSNCSLENIDHCITFHLAITKACSR
ncbi:hypothetical protein PR048_032283 [Dryococelus australis]|uniref:Transposase n=1 Tax=Dryococelus australis TaxID=614101 RepID=A0ABQ9G1T2_9NEOP|nr:hypothetical protein PR048_032283 [Dryococelus australis]